MGGRWWFYRKLPRFDGRVWFLLGAMLVFRFGQGLYYPFSTIYFHNTVGIPLSLVEVGLAALAAASVASGLVSGPLTDRYGRKPLMLLALSGSAATFLAYAFVGGIRGYLVVSVVAGLAGVAGLLRQELPRGIGLAGRVLSGRERTRGDAIPVAGCVPARQTLQGRGALRLRGALRRLLDGAAPHGVLYRGPHRVRGVLHAGGDDPGGRRGVFGRRTRPPGKRGTYLALFGCCFGTGYGVSPVVAGLLLDARTPEIIWAVQLVAAALSIVGLVLVNRLRKRSTS